MKTKGLQKLLSLVVLAFLAGCSTNTNPNSNQPEIGEVTWTLANIDPDFFNNGSLETAFYNFNINVFHPGGIENIKRIQVIQPSSEAFTIFNSETDQYPADFTADHAAFNCLCWLYSASEPHAFELGTYTVKVSLAGDKTLSSKFDIVNPYGQDASSLIYTPEENPAATPQMPSRPMLENFTVDDHGITYNFIQAKSDATYYQLNFFDSDGYFRGSSKLFESELGNIDVRLAKEDLTFIDSIEQFSILASNVTKFLDSKSNKNGTFVSISAKLARAQYYSQGSAYSSKPNIVIRQNVDSNIISGTQVTFNLSETQDDLDKPEDIWYRWDWENDGVFDTDFSHELHYERVFTKQGNNYSKLQAVNSQGQLSEWTTDFYVFPNPGSTYIPIPASSLRTIENQTNEGFYTAGMNPNELFYIDTNSGSVLATAKVLGQISGLQLNKDETLLYVTESKKKEDESGYSTDLITFNANTLEELARVNLPHSIDTFAVTSTGIVIGATYETDQHQEGIVSYKLSDGSKLNEIYPKFPHGFLLSRDESIILMIYTDMTFNYYTIDPDTGLVFGDVNDINDDTKHNVLNTLASTDELLITVTGEVYKLEVTPEVILTKLSDLLPDSERVRGYSIDTNNNLLFILTEEQSLSVYNLLSLEYIKTLSTDIDWSQYVFNTEDSVVILGYKYSSSVIYPVAHPCPSCAFNQKPIADLTSDKSGTVTFFDEVQLDASLSYDSQTTPLKFRWDFDSDGHWDTEFSENSIETHQYRLAGEITTIVQVKDEYGLVAEATLTFLVTNDAGDPEIVIDHEPDLLPFIPHDALFDESRNQIYLTDRPNGVIYTLDISTGRIINQVTVGLLPENIAISKDRQFLAVSIPIADHTEYTSADKQQTGFIAVIDLENDTLTRYLDVDIDPYELSISTDGTLFISSGSGQWSNILLYDFDTGIKIPQIETLFSTSSKSSIAIHPNNIHLYFTSRYIARYTADGDNRYYHQTVSRHNPGAALKLTSDGSKLITQSGLIFITGFEFENALTFIGSFNNEGVKYFSISEQFNEILFIAPDNSIHRSDLLNGNLLETYSIELVNPKYIFTTTSEVLVFDQVGNETKIHRINRP